MVAAAHIGADSLNIILGNAGAFRARTPEGVQRD